MPAGSSLCISKGMLGTVMENMDLDQDGQVDHIRFSLRNQFLHPDHPLGWIRRLTITINDDQVASELAYFVIRGQWISTSHIHTIREIWWEMREVAEIYIRHPGGIVAGRHKVDIAFEISNYVHTPSIDDADRYPRFHQELSGEMELAA